MSSILDILGSIIIRGAIIIVMLNLNLNLHDALYDKTAKSMVKQNLTIPSQVFLSDLNLAGYNATPATTFIVAGSNEIQFLADVDNNSVTDNVHYYLSTATGLVPEHRILYREVNGLAYEIARDVDSLTFRYYDVNGNITSNVTQIKSVYVQFSIVSSYALNNAADSLVYQKAFWERQITPLNLQL